MAAGEEKEVTMTPSTSTGETRKRGRPRRNKTQRSGEAIVTKEETVITKKGNEPAKGIKVESQQVFKLVPKAASSPSVTATKKSASSPVVAPVVPTKVTILPKKRVQKITILGKTPKKPFVPPVSLKTEAKTEAKTETKSEAKQKITLPASKKTRKQYKERRLRIEL